MCDCELWEKLARSLLSNNKINAQSFARISGIASSLAFSEDVVVSDVDGDGEIDCEKAFSAMGNALSELDVKGSTELCDPNITVEFTNNVFSISLYGEKIYSEETRQIAAVSPYCFSDDEYRAAFVLAVATAIFKARN